MICLSEDLNAGRWPDAERERYEALFGRSRFGSKDEYRNKCRVDQADSRFGRCRMCGNTDSTFA